MAKRSEHFYFKITFGKEASYKVLETLTSLLFGFTKAQTAVLSREPKGSCLGL